MSAIGWLPTLAGAALIAAGLRDVFHTLLHPSGVGQLSPLVFRAVRGLAERSGRGRLVAGPASVVVTVVVWASLVGVGFALLYLPHLPEAFAVADGIPSDGRDGPLTALYLSLTALATLGFGDIVATAGPLRLLLVVEGLLGFGLLTASITWILSVYPALARRRSLAGRIVGLLEEGTPAQLAPWAQLPRAAPVLHDIAAGIAAVRVDLLQFPATYYFEVPDRRLSLAAVLGRLLAALERADLPAELAVAVEDVRGAARGLGLGLAGGPFGLPQDGQAALRAYVERPGD